jgi:hypothetical protein
MATSVWGLEKILGNLLLLLLFLLDGLALVFPQSA